MSHVHLLKKDKLHFDLYNHKVEVVLLRKRQGIMPKSKLDTKNVQSIQTNG